jgi:hypothetical protein
MGLTGQKFLLLSALLFGCSDATAPRYVAGYYVLESVNGQPVPAILYSDANQTYSIVSGTLFFDDDANADVFLHRREVNQGTTIEDRFAGILNYRLDGNTIEIDRFPPCPPNALCDTESFLGTLSETSLTIFVGRPIDASPQIYQYRLAGGIAALSE